MVVVPIPEFFDHFGEALKQLLPSGAVIAMENTRFTDEVRSALKPFLVAPGQELKPGTVWPKTQFLHFSAGNPALEALQALVNGMSWQELTLHLYAYRAGELLVEWHDAGSDPIQVSETLDVAAFARILWHPRPAPGLRRS